MDVEELLQIADAQDDFLERMASRHKARLQRAITRLERRIVNQVSNLSTTEAGLLLGPRVNLSQAQKLHSDLTSLFDEEYGEASRSVLSEYSRSLPEIRSAYEAMGSAAEFTGVDREMMETLKRRDYAEYARFGQQAQDRIASAMYDSVVSQAPFSSLVATIAGTLTGHADARGRPMSRYAEQMANDGIMNFHNAVNMKKGKDLGFKSFLYYGDIIKDSREFCIYRAGKVYTEEEIKGWTGNWAGKSGPAMTHRGGYNCRHHWQPVRTAWIPDGEIEVESWFDRAQAPSFAELPAELKSSTKLLVYQQWKRAQLIDGKTLSAADLFKKMNLEGTVKKSSVSSWVNTWGKGMNLPKGWQSVVKDLEAELGGVVVPPPSPAQVVKAVAAVAEEIKPPPVSPTTAAEIQAMAKEAVKDITRDALVEAREKLSGSIDRFAAQRKEIYDLVGVRSSDPVLASDGIHRMSLKAGKYRDPLDDLAHRAFLEGKDPNAIKDLLRPMIARHEALLDEIGEQVLTILDLDSSFEPVTFRETIHETIAKSFYSDATNRKKSVESMLKQFGFKSSTSYTLSPIEAAFKTGFTPLPVDATMLQKAQQKVSARMFEHLRMEKRARYQWLKLVDEKTYRAERRKVTDRLVHIKPGKDAYWKSAEGRKLIKAEKQLKTAIALDHVPIDLLESMEENGYRIDFSSKAGRSFFRGRDSTIFETYKKTHGGGKTGWDVISHEFGHAIDHYFDENFSRTGGKWGGLRAESYVTNVDGDNYRGWFNKQHEGIRNKYSNGDGEYFDNNWIDNYEGRIYGGGVDRVGEEWWAMNNQRFAYNNFIRKYRYAPGGDELVAKLGKVSWHLREDSWDKAVRLYPELSNFIKNLFDGRTALY